MAGGRFGLGMYLHAGFHVPQGSSPLEGFVSGGGLISF